MANQWFKFYGGEYLSDPKIERLSPAERSCWLTLLCMASMTDDGVIEFLTVESLLTKSGIRMNPYNEGDWEKCQGILVLFTRMKMITVNEEEGTITIKNWDKRQERATQTPYERVKKYRENKKSKNDNAEDSETAIQYNDILENDNEMITYDNANDNDRREEKRIEENRIDTQDETSSSEEIPLVIKSFEAINPACKKYYGNKTQRKACEDLIAVYSFDRVVSVIEKTLPRTNTMQFFPHIDTPDQLYKKWTALEDAIKKYQAEKVEKVSKNKVAF